MSTKRLTTSHPVMKSLERIDYAIIWLGCKRDSANRTLTLSQIHTFYLMSLVISTLTIKSLSNMIQRRIFGSSSQPTHHKVKASIS
jgi:hypothetical protein